VWRDENEWPLARAVDTEFYLGANGALSTLVPTAGDDGGHDDYTYDPAITPGGAVVMTPDFPPGPVDQSAVEAREDVLVYTSDVLDADVEVTGRVRATLFALPTGPRPTGSYACATSMPRGCRGI
jgi:predicted acyl esterase